jgi:hypothetical protein
MLLISRIDPRTRFDLWVLPLQGNREPRVVLQTPFDDRTAHLSPDGKWMAYVSDESGRFEVYVQPFPGPGGKQKISTEGGTEPVWARNGELFYRAGRDREQMMVVEIQTESGFVASKPRPLFSGDFLSGLPNTLYSAQYAVSADGQRLLMLQPPKEPTPGSTQLIVIQNWGEELKRLVPVK